MNTSGYLPASTSARLLAWLFVTALIAPAAYAAPTDLADLPPAVTTQIRPNIMFMLDNSGSMQNIVPDAPYDPNVSYLALDSCPVANRVGNGVAPPTLPTTQAAELWVVSGVPRIRIGSTTYDYGTASGRRCFNPTQNYLARINADGTGCGTNNCPTAYLGAVYSGNYLNWYFGNAPGYTSNATFGAGIRIKPGTKSRLTIAKAAAVNIVESLGSVRTGLFTYNNGNGGTLLEVMDDLNTTKKAAMTAEINAIAASGATPLAETLADIGKYFVTGYTGDLKLKPKGVSVTRTVAQVFPHAYNDGSGMGTPSAPIQQWCQKSFTVLLTDGRPQSDQNEHTNIGSDLLDYDGDCTTGCNTHDRKTNRQYESNGSDYLDDVAKALFEMDLRPDLQAPAGQTKLGNNVSTYTIGFADAQVVNDPLMQDTANQGGGKFLTAGNEAELVTAFEDAVQDILQKDGAASAVAVANAYVTAGDDSVFSTRYNSGNWTGDLIAYPLELNPAAADFGEVKIQNPKWNTGCTNPNALIDPSNSGLGKRGCSAQVKLTERNFDSDPRFVVSYSGAAGSNQGVIFQPSSAATDTKLSVDQTNLLKTPAKDDAAAVIAYLRGDRSAEGTAYRVRGALLGDIVSVEPVIVREAPFSYADVGYSAFKTAKASRTKVVYQGANDGMVHAFNADTGREMWAYVPNLILASLNQLTRIEFTHKFYVDGNATMGDVDFKRTGGESPTTETPSQWHSILVGGLGKGGRGFYALDVSTPLSVTSTESDAAARVLWEFPNDSTRTEFVDSVSGLTLENVMGYSYGRPVIVKTSRGWVVLVTSGYNNGTTTGGDGKGYLFVLNARTGALIKAIRASIGGNDTSDTNPSFEGNAATPSGLAQISAFIENPRSSARADQVYGGDLLGNLWRFDLSDANPNNWSVTKVARLVDDDEKGQPVSTKPELTKLVIGGTEKRLILVGSGKYLAMSDVDNTDVQTVYGLTDDLSIKGNNTVINPLRSNLVEQVLALEEESTTERAFATVKAVEYSSKKGWYVDMPAQGERVNTNPVLVRGALVFSSNIPSGDSCGAGGSSWFNVFDYKTGGTMQEAWSSISLGNTIASRPVPVKTSQGVRALTQKSNLQIDSKQIDVGDLINSARRVSWKEVIGGK